MCYFVHAYEDFHLFKSIEDSVNVSCIYPMRLLVCFPPGEVELQQSQHIPWECPLLFYSGVKENLPARAISPAKKNVLLQKEILFFSDCNQFFWTNFLKFYWMVDWMVLMHVQYRFKMMFFRYWRFNCVFIRHVI